MVSAAPLSAAELAAAASKTGSDPAPPSEDEIKGSPGAAVAGLFLVGFRGTLRDTPFLKRLAAIPYGGLLLTREQLRAAPAALRADLQAAGGGARGRPPGAAHRRQAGGRGVQRVRQPRARGAGRRRRGHARRDRRESAKTAAEQLDALGVGVNLAPNADIAVAGGPGQGRAFSDTPAQVTSAVQATVAEYNKAGVAAVVGPFPGDGAASQDPNAGPAPVGLSLEDLRDADMKPFAAVAKGDDAAPAMQMTNAIYVGLRRRHAGHAAARGRQGAARRPGLRRRDPLRRPRRDDRDGGRHRRRGGGQRPEGRRRHARHPRRAGAAGPGLPRRRRRRALRRHLAPARSPTR